MSFRPSSSSSTSSSRGTKALHRGLACLVCRKRKIRCDALKPSCSPCQKLIANWKPESGTPRPACIYDPTSPNAPFLPFNPSVESLPEANKSRSRANNPATHPFPSPSSSPTPSTQQSLNQEALAPNSSSTGLQEPYKEGSSVNFRKRGLSKRPSSEHRGEKQASASVSLSRSRSQSQTRSAGGGSETATSAPFSSSDNGKEHNPDRTYSKLPRRASSPSLRSLSQEGDAQGQAPFTGTPFMFTSDFSRRPPKSILDRLTNLFFKYCSISSIIRRDIYNPEKAISGSTIDQALLRAILAIACLYSDSLEDVHESFWTSEGEGPESIVALDANGVAQAHSSVSRRLIDLVRGDDGQMEAVLPISLLLVSYGMQSISSQGDLQVQFEICWSSIAIKRLAFYKLPSPSSTSISSTSSTLLQERITVFWTFYILDRQYQARMAIPPLLSEQDISTLIPSTNDGPRISTQSSMSLNSSVFVTTETRKLSWVLYIRVVRFFSLCLSRRLRRGEDDSFNASFDAEVAEFEDQTALLSSQVRGEVPKPTTHLSAIQLLLHASKLIHLENYDEKSLDSPKFECLEASRSVAQSAKASPPSSLKYLDFFEVISFWIAGKSLIRYLASNVRTAVASQDEIVEDLKSILACLWKHSTRGKVLARSLIALYKTIDSPEGFLSTPSFWPPEARILDQDESFPRSSSASQVKSLLQLGRQVEDSELEFLNR